jgi:Cupredoxin-like domain
MRERRSVWLGAVVLAGLLELSCHREPGAAVAPAAPALPAAAPAAAPGAAAVAGRRVTVQVTEAGFVPDTIGAEAGKPITLAITRKTDHTCARELTIKGQPGKTDLPLDREVEVTYVPPAAGKIPFGCAMGMMVSGAFDVK